MESIIALSKLVSRTDNKQLLNILPQVLLKIRPCFEKESAALRAAAFTLFGELGARVGSSCSDFSNHLHTNIVTILLHLNDEHDDVKKTCALALYRLHGLLGCSQASVLIEEELTEGRLPVSYHGTVKDLAAILVDFAYPSLVTGTISGTLLPGQSESIRPDLFELLQEFEQQDESQLCLPDGFSPVCPHPQTTGYHQQRTHLYRSGPPAQGPGRRVGTSGSCPSHRPSP